MDKIIILVMTKFSQSVINIVSQIPRGKVVSYGQVAAYVGVPRAAQQVGWVLRQLEDIDIPWWRVINNEGRISIKGNIYNDANSQRKHLRAERVEVGEDFTLDIEKYRFVASPDQLWKWDLDKIYLHLIWNKFKTGY